MAAPHPFLKKLGSRISRVRKSQGISQEELADLARLDRSYMSGIERGIRNVSVLKLAAPLSLHRQVTRKVGSREWRTTRWSVFLRELGTKKVGRGDKHS